MKKFLRIQAIFSTFALGLYYLLLWLTNEPFPSAFVPLWVFMFIFSFDFGILFFYAFVVGWFVTQLFGVNVGLLSALASSTTLMSFVFGSMESGPLRNWQYASLFIMQLIILHLALLCSVIRL